MKEIMNVYIYKMRNATYIGFIALLLERLKNIDPATLGILAEYNAMLAKLDEMSKVLMLAQKSEQTKDIEAADLRRDNAWSGIRANVQSHFNHFKDSKKAAAKLLDDAMNVVGGNIINRPLVEEMTLIGKFLAGCRDKPTLTNAVDVLLLTEWIDELEAANNGFKELYGSRVAEIGDTMPTIVLKQRRTEASALYEELKLALTANAFIGKYGDVYLKAINQWNVLGEEQNRLLALQQGNGDGEEDTPAAPPSDGVQPVA